MTVLGYIPCLAIPGVWLKTQVRDGREYYSYILCYIDAMLVIHADAVPILNRIDMYMKLKVGSVGDPDIYLGDKLRKVAMDNGNSPWGSALLSMSKWHLGIARNISRIISLLTMS
jgi:hypothetical protein